MSDVPWKFSAVAAASLLASTGTSLPDSSGQRASAPPSSSHESVLILAENQSAQNSSDVLVREALNALRDSATCPMGRREDLVYGYEPSSSVTINRFSGDATLFRWESRSKVVIRQRDVWTDDSAHPTVSVRYSDIRAVQIGGGGITGERESGYEKLFTIVCARPNCIDEGNSRESVIHRDACNARMAKAIKIGIETLRLTNSGVATNFSIRKNVDLVGGDLGPPLKKVEYAECAVACKSNSGCRAFSYDKWNKYCYLKQTITSMHLDPHSDTGWDNTLPEPARARTPETITDFSRYLVGSIYRNATVGSRAACASICSKESNCVGYDASFSGSACFLYSEIDDTLPGHQETGIKMQRDSK